AGSFATRGARHAGSPTTRSSAGHRSRWTKATRPATSLPVRMARSSSSAEATLKMRPPLGWPHQLPFTGSPATSATLEGAGPVSGTTPWRRTNAAAARAVTGRAAALLPINCPSDGSRDGEDAELRAARGLERGEDLVVEQVLHRRGQLGAAHARDVAQRRD